jgi:hypothetical protein
MALRSSSHGSIRLMGLQALSYASSIAGYAVSAGSSITLPNGKTLEIPESDIPFSMPAEFEPHSGCWIAWPKRPDVWRDQERPAKKAFTDVITAVARFEPVTVIAHRDQVRTSPQNTRMEVGVIVALHTQHLIMPSAVSVQDVNLHHSP